MYVKEIGVVVVLIVGLYYSWELLKWLEIKGIDFVELILYVGLGIFCSIDVEDLLKYKMDVEYFWVLEELVCMVNRVIEIKYKVCVVGIIFVRVIEFVVFVEGMFK